jgi:hypothetical protein
MSGKDLFGVVVRTFGLACFTWGLWNLLIGVAQAAHIVTDVEEETSAYIVAGMGSVLLSLYFLRGAPQLMRFCYPNDAK